LNLPEIEVQFWKFKLKDHMYI